MLASRICRLSSVTCIKSSSRPVLALATVEAHQRRNFRVRPKPMWSSDFQEMPPKLSPELQNAKLAIFGGDFIPSPEDTKDIVQAFQIDKEASSAESASQLKAMRSEYAKLGEQIASEEKRYVELLAAERRSMLAYEEKQYVKIAKFRETTFMEKILSSEDTMDIVETLQRDKQTSTATATFPSPLKEYSVIYTDRAMNLMAAPFTKQTTHALSQERATSRWKLWRASLPQMRMPWSSGMGSSPSGGVPSWNRARSLNLSPSSRLCQSKTDITHISPLPKSRMWWPK